MTAHRHRVLYVITRLEPGGAQRVALYTAANLDRQAFAVGLAWGPGDLLDSEAAKLTHIERFPVADLVRPVSGVRDLKALASLRAIMRGFAPHVVHTHSSKAGVLGRLAAALEGVPASVHTIHGFGFTPLQRLPVRALFFAAERIISHLTDHWVAVSRRNLRRGIELGLFGPENASVIRAGIPVQRFRTASGADAVRKRLGLTAEQPLVTQIGNFKPQKGPLDCVRVAARVAELVPAVRFVMVGDGPLRARAEALAADLGQANRIIFCGWWDDVPGLLAASDVSILTSHHEGLPCAVIESLAAAVPVVATAVDGTVEVVEHGVNGFLAPPGDIAGLAQGVSQLLTDPELRAQMAAAAAAGKKIQEFDQDLMVRQQEDLYRWLLSRNR